MKINIPVTIGALIGWFVAPPMIDSILILFSKQMPLINRTPLESLEYSVLGLSIVILFGLIAGSFDE